jgi:peptidoglycan/LPS O-acetylase OafA/YrhL
VYKRQVGREVLFQSEFIALNKHIIGGGTFSSNLILWNESGYFDINSEKKPLLHLWSLGVEEQFYIAWPLLLTFAFQRGFSLATLTIGIAFISFSFSIYLLNIGERTELFYSPLSRSWELMIGALLAQVNIDFRAVQYKYKERLSSSISILGIVLILIAGFSFTKQLAYPGWAALLPVVGALFLIVAGRDALVNKLVLSNKVLVYIGLISYPLYIWHWPILSFINILFGASSNVIRGAGICVAFALALITYKWIEIPIRTGKLASASYLLVISLIFVVLLAGVSGINEKKLYIERDFLIENSISLSGSDGGDMGFAVKGCELITGLKVNLLPDCRTDSRGNIKFAILGDSKASALFPGLIRFASSDGGWILMGGAGSQGSPVPILSDDPDYTGVQTSAKFAINSLQNNESIKVVLIVVAARSIFKLKNEHSIEDMPYSNKYSSAYNGFRESVVKLLDSGKKIIFLIDNPTLKDPTSCIPRIISVPLLGKFNSQDHQAGCMITFEDHLFLSSQYRKLLYNLAEIDPERISVVDSNADFCMESGYCTIAKEGRLLYSYTDHISDYASGIVAKRINTRISEINR